MLLETDSLLFVLLNPPAATTGARTVRAVSVASDVLGYGTFEIANLCSLATRSVVELNALGTEAELWHEARAELQARMIDADAMVLAWGVAGLSGDARRNREAQVEWLRRTAADLGLDRLWTVGAAPRHPSRWHQFLSDRYGRVPSGNFADRIRSGLQEVEVKDGQPWPFESPLLAAGVSARGVGVSVYAPD
jgi:hypothetical protein